MFGGEIVGMFFTHHASVFHKVLFRDFKIPESTQYFIYILLVILYIGFLLYLYSLAFVLYTPFTFYFYFFVFV